MIEIDILPASTQSKGGDSALIRVGTFDYKTKKNNQVVILIDGGYQENSERIAEHLRTHYNTNTIDIAIITHPDMDHLSGFKKLLEDGQVRVRQTFIHDPWEHKEHIFARALDGRRTVKSIGNAFEQTLNALSATLDMVSSKNIEPFGPSQLPNINAYILGPSREYYRDCLHQFPGMDGETKTGPSDIYTENTCEYSDQMDHFLDDPKTSPKNNSSVITLLHDSAHDPIALFTGDAGVEAITSALDVADQYSLRYKNVKLFQIPHHGSIKNISEELIDRIAPKSVYVSAPPEKKEHPSRLLLNHIHNKGVGVSHIQDRTGICYSYDGAESRPDWTPVQKFNLYSKVYALKTTFKRYFYNR